MLSINIGLNHDDQKFNVYYFNEFIPFFDKLIYKMSTWSAVMKETFNSPNINVSSSNCESEFKYIKRFLFRNVKRMRVDKFMFQHIKDIVGRMLFALADLNSFKKNMLNHKGINLNIIVEC